MDGQMTMRMKIDWPWNRGGRLIILLALTRTHGTKEQRSRPSSLNDEWQLCVFCKPKENPEPEAYEMNAAGSARYTVVTVVFWVVARVL